MKTRRRSCLLVTLAACFLAVVPANAATGRWEPVGPSGGGPTVIAADPQIGARLFAAFPWGPYQHLETLVMRSEDGGTTWQEANHGLEGERIIALAVDPQDTDRLYAVAAKQGCSSDDPGGVYRSDDAGASWHLLATSEDIGGLACSAGLLALSDAVLVGTRDGVARSADGGATWQQIPLSPAPDTLHTLLRDPRDKRVLYAAGWQARFKSRDGGLTWTLLDDPAAHSQQSVRALALAASAPDTLYAFASGFLQSVCWRSRDGGATWEERGAAPGALFLDSASLLVDPRNPETVFVGTDDGLWVSRDGGSTFRRLRRDLPSMTYSRSAYPGVSDLALDAAGRILLASPLGLWSSTAAGFHWEAAALAGVHANPVRFLRFDPFRPRRFVFTSFDTLHETRNGGARTAPLSVPRPGLLQDLAFDPHERDRLFALTRQEQSPPVERLFESRDGGQSWGAPSPVPAGTEALAAPVPGILLAGAGNRILLRDGSGRWWEQLSVVPIDERGGFFFRRFQADPYRPETLFAFGVDRYLHGGEIAVVYCSLDAGQTWRRWEEDVTTLAFAPGQLGAVYFVRGTGIYRRRAAGGTAQRIGGLPPNGWVRWLLIDRSDPQTFYAATDSLGILVSQDRAKTWNPAAPGLPLDGKLRVTALVQDPLNAQRLYATPSSGGLWRLDLPPR
ncbi:MAG TPA: hypothetical protein DD490_21150 [Acidobacteria bacterium]|nr:hypothetical protein [Acidobacteriota bacterium]